MVAEPKDIFYPRLPLEDTKIGITLGFDCHGLRVLRKGFVDPYSTDFHAIAAGNPADRRGLHPTLAFQAVGTHGQINAQFLDLITPPLAIAVIRVRHIKCPLHLFRHRDPLAGPGRLRLRGN